MDPEEQKHLFSVAECIACEKTTSNDVTVSRCIGNWFLFFQRFSIMVKIVWGCFAMVVFRTTSKTTKNRCRAKIIGV